jgi:hypothetical protein
MKNLLILAALLFLSASAFGQVVTVTGPVTLTWVGPTLNEDGTAYVDRGGFKVYWGEEVGGSCSNLSNVIDLTDPDQTVYTADYPLSTVPVTLCFAMTAVDLAGHESVPSNLVQKTIDIVLDGPPGPPVLQSVTMNLTCTVDTGISCTVTVQ